MARRRQAMLMTMRKKVNTIVYQAFHVLSAKTSSRFVNVFALRSGKKEGGSLGDLKVHDRIRFLNFMYEGCSTLPALNLHFSGRCLSCIGNKYSGMSETSLQCSGSRHCQRSPSQAVRLCSSRARTRRQHSIGRRLLCARAICL